MSTSSKSRKDLEAHLGLAADPNIDAVDTPEKAQRWIEVCKRNPTWADRFQDTFIAAQLTLLGHGIQPMIT